MPPPTPILDPRNAIHLYRHLLREASYLPPIAAPYIKTRIQTRFRRWRWDPSPSYRLRKAASNIRTLYGANAGKRMVMSYILMLSLGRIGARRRALLTAMQKLESPGSTAEVLEALNTRSALEEMMLELQAEEDNKSLGKELKQRQDGGGDWLDKWDKGKMLALARSQADLGDWPNRPNITVIYSSKLDPSAAVPPLNIWGRPFAIKTARTKTKKWWMALADKLLPPLPRGEWDILKKLAEGTAGPEWDPPPRRYAPAATEPPKQPYGFGDMAMKPVRMLERHNSRQYKLAVGTETEAEAAQPWNGPALGVHNLTPRLWQRLYMEIWRLCPTMTRRTEIKSGWKVEWGRNNVNAKMTPASSVHDAFFRDAEAIEMNRGTSRRRGRRGGWANRDVDGDA